MRRQIYYLVRGGGAPQLAHKQQFHRLRAEAEREVLAEAREDDSLFRPNCCPVCHRREAGEHFSSPVGFSFAICRHDGTVFMDPVPTESTLSRLYNSAGYSFNWTARASMPRPPRRAASRDYETLCRLFDFPADRRPKLLDVGCATGGFLLEAAARFDVEGVELNAATAAVARERGLEVTVGALSDLPGEDRYDVITMLQLIEHVPEPAELLRDAWRLLRPGGMLYLDTPNIDSASFDLFRERHTHVSGFGHVSLFTGESLKTLVDACGFEVVHHEYAGGMDIALHDLVSRRISPARFRHRRALYSPRLLHACALADQVSRGRLSRSLIPKGNPSYQIAAGRKPAA